MLFPLLLDCRAITVDFKLRELLDFLQGEVKSRKVAQCVRIAIKESRFYVAAVVQQVSNPKIQTLLKISIQLCCCFFILNGKEKLSDD